MFLGREWLGRGWAFRIGDLLHGHLFSRLACSTE